MNNIKSFFSRHKQAFTEPRYFLDRFLSYTSKCFPDKLYIDLKYLLRFGHKVNWENPQTFNEKQSWIKINDRNPLYTKLADKYEVKKFVAGVIGEEYVVPCLGIWDKVEDIDYLSLPEQFVIKCTHDSSGAIIVRNKDKIDKASVAKKLKSVFKRNYYWGLREWPYKEIKPRVIADTFLDDKTAEGNNISLRDYKFWCFNGVPEYMYCTVKDENLSDIYENFYDKDFNVVNIKHGFPRHTPEFDRPKNYEKMWELAGKLAKASQTKWVRVDFFNVDGKIYFGEFTFFDWGGAQPFDDEQQDYELGEMLSLD